MVSNDSELSKASLSEDLRTGVGASAFKTFPQAQSERPTGMRPGEKKSNWFQRTFGSHPLVEEPVDAARAQ